MKKIFFLLPLLLSVFALSAQDSVFVRNTIRDLTSPQFHGRSAAFRGDSLAADYLAAKLKAVGAQPLTEGYLQHYTFNTCILDGKVELALGKKKLVQGVEFSPVSISKPCNGKYKMLYFDAKRIDKENEVQQFRDEHKKALSKSFVYLDVSDENELNKSALRTVNQIKRGNNVFGSAGVVLGVKSMPAMSIPANVKPMDYSVLYVKYDLMSAQPKKIKVRIDNRYACHHTQNVAAFVPGTRYKDSLVVFMGHYDHVGQVGSVYYPGAHDNASGASTVLDLARHFAAHPAEYTTVFLFFSGEESGLMGSKYFAKNPLIDLTKVKYMVNIDLFCGGDDGIIVFNAQAENTKAIFEKMKAVNAERGYVADIEPRKNSANSDHYPFTEKGCPAIFILTKGGAYGGYHSPTDTCEACRINKYNDVWNLLMETLGL